jgi:hypothetical protein
MHSNLRDERWLAQKEHIVDLVSTGKSIIDWPDSGIFWPGDMPEPQRRTDRNATERTTENDGYLWFSAVGIGSGAPIRNMIGNVAEYVFESAQEPGATTPMSPESIVELLDKQAKSLFVIGGSAMSPPELEIDRPYPVAPAAARRGFSDVGLRLAFAPPDESLLEKFKRLVAAQPYLVE